MEKLNNFYALLIGIDKYELNPHFPDLRGCVPDIDLVDDYLCNELKIDQDNIWKLTSPFEETYVMSSYRSARKEAKPTYSNIVKAFKEITEKAKSKDQVYIHYSGHGGQAKTIFPELKGEKQIDETLVPMDIGDKGRYLRDVEITTLLKRLTDKGCIVTVVFDSCHSGGATRGDGAIRGSRDGNPDTIERPENSAVTKNREELLENWREVTQKTKESWLANNQRDYVFLGACRPHEKAQEKAFQGKDRNGALTYWMFNTLRTVSTALTYQALYDRLKGKIISQCTNQVPMLFGEANRLIFGSKTKSGQYSLNVTKTSSTTVTLGGGKAQGISRGTRFGLYTAGEDVADKQKCLGIVEIAELQATECLAKILDEAESGIKVDREKIDSGLVAVMESIPVNLKHRVRFYQKQFGEGENELPQVLANKQTAALEKIRKAMKENGWLIETEEDEEGHFQVAVDRQGNYEISKNTPIGNLTPTLSIDDGDAPKEVVKRLVHLAKYQTAETLDNTVSELTDAVEFELLDAEKQTFPNPNDISLKSGDRLYVRLKNVSSKPLDVAILDFEATWEISQIPIHGDYGAFFSLQPGENTMTRLRFAVPDGESYKESVETLKLFVTRANGNANFQWLIMPPLDPQLIEEEDREKHRSLRGSLKEKEATRGAGRKSNPLNQLLSTIGADLDDPPEQTRKFIPDPDPDAEWLTKSISLTVQR